MGRRINNATIATETPTRRSHQRIVRSPLCDRIRAAWKPRIGYHELINAVFPYEEYPLAWRYSNNGGPPVCAMAFGKALRKLGLMRYDNHISGTPNAENQAP